MAARMGFFGHFVRTPSPSAAGFDASDNGLPTWVDMKVLDADNLLAAPLPRLRSSADSSSTRCA